MQGKNQPVDAPAASSAHAAQDRASAGWPAQLAVALRQAFEYAFPLVAMGQLRACALGTGLTPGTHRLYDWHHARKLCGPDDRWVTTPNADTLYSSLWLDLSEGPVTLSVPDTQGRYYSLAFLDMATNNFAMAGRRTTGTRAGSFVLVGPDWEQALPPNMRVIRAPGNDVLVLSRILVNGESDLPTVTALQDQYKVEPPGAATTPPAWQHLPPTGDGPQAFVDMANLMLGRNPPSRYEAGLLKHFAEVGIAGANCRWETLPSRVQAQWTDHWSGLLAALRREAAGADATFNGWRYSKECLGNFGTDYAHRARVALRGLLALEPVEASYPSTGVDHNGQPLSGAHRYCLRLSPVTLPVNAFWSLSMYQREPDGRSFFTSNPIGRYTIGDRTPGLSQDKDGTVQVLIQHDMPTDPAQRANWLPAPAGEFRLVLRAYEPKAELRDGRVRLPAVRRLDGGEQ